MYGLLHPNRIAWKLIKALILFSSLIAVVTTGVQLWSEYGRDMDAIQTRFMQVERSYLDSIAENVWEADRGRLDLLMGGIIEFPDFRFATVRDEHDATLAHAGEMAIDEDVLRRVYPLHYTFRDKNVKIGELEVVAGLGDVYQRVFDRVGLILISNAIKTFLVALFMFAVVYWLLTRHLDVMSKFARNMDFSLQPKPLTLERGVLSGRRDEMDQMADALNDMQSKLYRSFEELRVFNDELEDRVQLRTKELSDEVEVRKMAESKLAESESRLRDIAESGSDWMWEMGPDLRFTYLSGGLVAEGAIDRTGVVGRRREDMAVDLDEDREKWAAHLDDMENHRPFRNFEYKVRKDDGSYAHVRVSGKPIFDADGAFQGYRGVSTNITAEVEAAQKIAKAEGELRVLSSAVEQNPSMVFITDPNGTILYVNDKFTEITGYSRQDAIGRNPRLLKSVDTPGEIHTEMWDTLLSGQVWRGEIKDVRKNGTTFWAYATLAPVKDADGYISHYVATHEDITERKEAEKRLRIATEEAQLANRAKSELMANMSHELRTPLNAIIGFSDSMLSNVFGPLENERYADYVRDIHSSGQHLLELINDILDVSAVEAGKLELRPEPMAIEDVARTSLKLVQHRADDGQVRLSHHFEAGLPGLLGDERRVKQVLLNLLSNAVKFTPEKGRVTLNITTASNGGIRVEIEDTGIGMDAHGIEKALTQFGQVDSKLSRRYEGTGLGLPLSKGLVEAHGGTLDIRSRLGHGTTVVVHFPPERSIASTVVQTDMKSPDTDVGGESVTSASGDLGDKKNPTVH